MRERTRSFWRIILTTLGIIILFFGGAFIGSGAVRFKLAYYLGGDQAAFEVQAGFIQLSYGVVLDAIGLGLAYISLTLRAVFTWAAIFVIFWFLVAFALE